MGGDGFITACFRCLDLAALLVGSFNGEPIESHGGRPGDQYHQDSHWGVGLLLS